jgi:cell division protein FtsB
VAIVGAVAVLWVFLAPGSGIMALLSKISEQKKLEQEIAQLKQENEELQNDINRLENDPLYLEEVARREYGLLKKNERVFDFLDSNSSNTD